MAQEGFIGEIRAFGGNFAPRSWAFCNGQLLSIAQNTALFSILGTTYGGDGRTTFALPDLRGRVAVHPGTGPGLSTRRLGERGGRESEVLNITQIPAHNHNDHIQVGEDGKGIVPVDTPANHWLGNSVGTYRSAAGSGNLGGVQQQNTGGSLSHTNMAPYECVNFIIALQGVFPSRS